MNRQVINRGQKIVFKVGSSLLISDDGSLNMDFIKEISAQLVAAQKSGRQIALVSSGAVAVGMRRLGWSTRPSTLIDMQVAAAVGQMGLIDAYEESFVQHGTHTAQMLITAEDMANRSLYLNARSTIKRLWDFGILPIVNENDVIAMEDLRFGDNDLLAAMLTNLIDADLLVLMTDSSGLFDDNGEVIDSAAADNTSLDKFVKSTSFSKVGSGGMLSKLKAARIALRSGTHTVIVSGRESDIVRRVLAGEDLGTFLYAKQGRVGAWKRWLASGISIKGHIVLDDGAVKAICKDGKSLLPVGVRTVSGDFERGDAVVCVDMSGVAVAHGLINYASSDVTKIMGKTSNDIEQLIGYALEDELIHRDNLVLLDHRK